MSDASVELLRVFSRPGCHLCEQLIEQLLPLVEGELKVEVVNIDADEDLISRFATRIPVVEFRSNEVCQYHLDVPAIQAILVDINNS